MSMQPGALVTQSIRLVRPIEDGGMGSVWLAEHSGLKTNVVVKFLLQNFERNPEMQARFAREAAAAAQLRSPYVVQMMDHGVSETGIPFIVMEHLEGEDLSQRLERERILPPPQVATLVRQVCKGLALAHERGVIHRDIKPANIFLADIGVEVFVKLLDFGVAKATFGDSLTTATGIPLGTPYYMSPEQVLGDRRLDQRTDIWSLGIVAFEALTGRGPIGARDSAGAVMVAICNEAFPKPSSLNPTLPTKVDDWFEAACARNPEDRFSNALAMAKALDAAIGARSSIPVRRDASTRRLSPTLAMVQASTSAPESSRATELRTHHDARVSSDPSGPSLWAANSGPHASARTVLALPPPEPNGGIMSVGTKKPRSMYEVLSSLQGHWESRRVKAAVLSFAAFFALGSLALGGRIVRLFKTDTSVEGMQLYWDRNDPDNLTRAIALLQKSCDAGFVNGCAGLGIAAYSGEGVARDESDAVRRLESSCKAGSALGCAGLGKAHVDGKGVDKDDKRAVELFEQACAAGEKVGCRGLGWALLTGSGVARDPKRAAELHKRACDAGDMMSCAALGAQYASGEGVSRESKRGAELYEKACRGGHMGGCVHIGEAHAGGVGVPKDPRIAAELFEKACSRNEMAGCVALADTYAAGRGRPADAVRARELWEQACGGGNMRGCTGLALAHMDGKGTTKDEKRGAELLDKACTGGDMYGCANLGVAFRSGAGVTKDDKRALELFQKACDAGDMRGCVALAGAYASGVGGAKDDKRAAELYERGCTGGHMRGCVGLGAALENGTGVPKDTKRAVELYDKACAGGDMAGCSYLGAAYWNGDGVTKDSKRSAELFEKACSGGDPYGCVNLGLASSRGSGVPKDLKRATELYDRACAGGAARGCSLLASVYENGLYGSGVTRDMSRAAELFDKACVGEDWAACHSLAGLYEYGNGVSRDTKRALSLHEKACAGGVAKACEAAKAKKAAENAPARKRGCEGDSECGSGMACRDSVCVADE